MEKHELERENYKFIANKTDNAKEVLSFMCSIDDKATDKLFSLLNDIFWLAVNHLKDPLNKDIFEMRDALHRIAQIIDETKHNEMFGNDWYKKLRIEQLNDKLVRLHELTQKDKEKLKNDETEE